MDIGPPGGRRDAEHGRLAVHLEAELFERGHGFRRRELGARELLNPRRIETDRGPAIGLAAGNDGVAGLAAAEFEDHLRGELEAQHLRFGIDAALEAVARVGVDAGLAAGRGGAQRIEKGAFDENRCGCFRGAGRLAAHDAAKPKHARLIRDHAHGLVHLVGLAVERSEALAVLAEPRHDGSLELVRVVDVQRPREADGDVIRHVDGGVDGPEPNRAQAALHPVGRGSVRQPANNPAREHRAGILGALGELQLDRDGAIELAFARVALAGVPQRAEPSRRQVAGDAAHAKAVGPVRRDGHVDHRIVQTHDVHEALPDLVRPCSPATR